VNINWSMFLLVFILTVCCFVVTYLIARKTYFLQRLFGVYTSAEVPFDVTNFIFVVITAVWTTQILYTDGFPTPPIVSPWNQTYQDLCLATLGYVCAEFMFGVIAYFFSYSTFDLKREYLYYHALIVLAYSSVYFHQMGGPIVLLTLNGEIYSFLSYVEVFTRHNRTGNWYYIIPFCDFIVFLVNRVGFIAYLVFHSINEMYNNKSNDIILYFQIASLFVSLLFNIRWIFGDLEWYWSHLKNKME
jgi:hypothetical protein